MLENPDPVIVSCESSNPHEGTDEFFGPDVISRSSMTGVRHAAALYWNMLVVVGAVAQSKLSTTVHSVEGSKLFPDAPSIKIN